MTQATLNDIQLPSDGTNSGAKTPTMQKVIGVTAYDYPMMIPAREQLVRGVYRASMAVQSVAATAQNGTSTGFLWITVPISTTTRAIRIRKCTLGFNVSASTTMPTVARIGIARFTFTGTASGATLAGAKCNPDDASPSIDMRTATTGLTITLNTDPGSLLSSVLVPALHNVTAAGLLFMPTIDNELISVTAAEDEYITIKAGQGLVLYQPDAGTAADVRRFSVSLVWDEIEL